MNGIPKLLLIVWFACGLLGVALGHIRYPNKMKKLDTFALVIGIVGGVIMGAFTLYSAWVFKGDDDP